MWQRLFHYKFTYVDNFTSSPYLRWTNSPASLLSSFDCSVAEEDELSGGHGGRGHQEVGKGPRIQGQKEDDQGKWFA